MLPKTIFEKWVHPGHGIYFAVSIYIIISADGCHKIPLSFSELQGFATILAQFVRPFVRPFCAFDGFHAEINYVFEYEKTLEIVVISRVFTLGTA